MAFALSALRPSVFVAMTGVLEILPPAQDLSALGEAFSSVDDINAVVSCLQGYSGPKSSEALSRWAIPDVSLLSQRSLTSLSQYDWLRSILVLRHISSAAQIEGPPGLGAANSSASITSGSSKDQLTASDGSVAKNLASPWDVFAIPSPAKIAHLCISAAAESAFICRCASRFQGIISALSMALSAATTPGAATAAEYTEAMSYLVAVSSSSEKAEPALGDDSRQLLDPGWVLGNCAAELLAVGGADIAPQMLSVALSMTEDELSVLCSVLRISSSMLSSQVRPLLVIKPLLY